MSLYSHTQRGIIRPLLLLVAVTCSVAASYGPLDKAAPVFFLAAAVLAFLACAFGSLTVRDEGERLTVRFGPIPLFRTTVPYAKIIGAAKDRSTFLCGWGIHLTRKGWLWNIGGFDCVRIEMGTKSLLIGTDEPDLLVTFLRSKICGRGN
jgi:hypothetical protein